MMAAHYTKFGHGHLSGAGHLVGDVVKDIGGSGPRWWPGLRSVCVEASVHAVIGKALMFCSQDKGTGQTHNEIL